MDRGHQQRINSLKIEKTESELLIRCKDAGNISIEQIGIRKTAKMFEEVFGQKVILL